MKSILPILLASAASVLASNNATVDQLAMAQAEAKAYREAWLELKRRDELLGIASLSPEARDRIVSKGLKTFMDEGSADTRAQLQPLVEELQRNMETGGSFRNRRRPGPPK